MKKFLQIQLQKEHPTAEIPPEDTSGERVKDRTGWKLMKRPSFQVETAPAFERRMRFQELTNQKRPNTVGGRKRKKKKKKKKSAKKNEDTERANSKKLATYKSIKNSLPMKMSPGQKVGYYELRKKIDESNSRRVFCKNGKSLYLQFRSRHMSSQVKIDKELDVIRNSPLMKTNVKNIAKQSHETMNELMTQVPEHTEGSADLQDELASTPTSSAMNAMKMWAEQTYQTQQYKRPAYTKTLSKQLLQRNMTNFTPLAPNSPATSEYSSTLSSPSDEITNISEEFFGGTPQTPNSMMQTEVFGATSPPMSPQQVDPKQLYSEFEKSARQSAKDLFALVMDPSKKPNPSVPSSPPKKKKRATDLETCKQLMRLSPLLAMGRAIEGSAKKQAAHEALRLPCINLDGMNKEALEIKFKEDTYEKKMKDYMNERETKYAVKKETQPPADLEKPPPQTTMQKLTKKKIKPVRKKKNEDQFNLYSKRFKQFKMLLRGEKIDMDRSLINKLKYKDMMLAKNYVKQFSEVDMSKVDWKSMVNQMHRTVENEYKNNRQEERMGAKRIWFNNFVLQVYNPKYKITKRAKKVFSKFQEVILVEDADVNEQTFFRVMHLIPSHFLCKVDVQRIVSILAKGFTVDTKHFFKHFHDRNIPFEYVDLSDPRSSMKVYLQDSIEVNYDNMFDGDDKPAFTFQWPPPRNEIYMTK